MIRKGDILEYYKTGILGWEDIDESEQAGITLGQPVTIQEYDQEDNSVKINESVADTWISAEHFRKIINEN